jgi:NADH-quinone oxidoreductase subunit A
MYLTGFPILFLMFIFAAILPFIMLGVAQLVQIKSPNDLKESTYESGMPLFGDAKIRFDVKFYMYALLFIIFDIETIFLFPWALAFDKLGLFAFVEMMMFIGILALGLVYAWKKGALRWQ